MELTLTIYLVSLLLIPFSTIEELEIRLYFG